MITIIISANCGGGGWVGAVEHSGGFRRGVSRCGGGKRGSV